MEIFILKISHIKIEKFGKGYLRSRDPGHPVDPVKTLFIFSAISLAILLPAAASAQSARALIKGGNAAYGEELYSDALAAYDMASSNMPDSAYVHYNRGAALYQKAEYEEAAEAFEKAAMLADDEDLAALSKFNLGDAEVRHSKQFEQADPEKAINGYYRGLNHFRDALTKKPEMRDAAENMEIIRHAIRRVQQIQKQQQEQKKDAGEEMEKLIRDQQRAAEQSKQLSKKMDQQGKTQQNQQMSQQMAKGQEQTRQETEQLSKAMEQMSENKQAQEASKYLKDALKNQQEARDDLKKLSPKQAKQDQDEAVENLKKALAALSDDKEDKEDQKQDENCSDCEDGKCEKHGDKSEQEDQDQGEQQESGEQEDGESLSEQARDILDEEGENQEKLKAFRATGFKPVEKDW